MSLSARLGIVLLTFASPYLLADGVVMSNSCILKDHSFVSGETTTLSQTGVNNCLVTSTDPVSGEHGQASASTSVTLHLPVSGQAATPVGASVLTFASANPFFSLGPVEESGSAQTSATIDFLFTTTGPVRPGIIQLNQSGVSSVSFAPGPDRPASQGANISVGPLSQTCSAGSDPFASCSGSLINPMTRFLPTTTLPFILGQNFLFHEDVTLSVDSFRDIIEDGSTLTNFTFTLFEADGVTPVQIAVVVPEPASLPLWACGLFALLALKFTLRPLPHTG
jgi:hypothetical protein